MRSWGEIGFPWIYLGHTQVNYLPMIQICDLTGVYGLSFLIVVANLTVADTWRFFAKKGGARRPLAAKWGVVIGLLALTLLYGFRRLDEGNREQAAGAGQAPFRVALIQPGVPQERKLASYADPDLHVQERLQAEMNGRLETELRAISRELDARGEPRPDLYLLPESAVTNTFFSAIPELMQMVHRWARSVGAPVFLGANRYVPPKDPNATQPGPMYNSAFLVRPDSPSLNEYYDKVHLVPFGEYASYLRYIPGAADKILQIADFNMGEGPRAFTVSGRDFGCVICFESCFAYLFRWYNRLEIDFMVIVTNDAWYGLSTGPRRHQSQAIFRAVEMRRPIVRAANTGISCVVDPWGRTTALLPLEEGEMRHIVAQVPLRAKSAGAKPARSVLTIYMRPWGEWLVWLCFVYCGVALLSDWISRRGETRGVGRPKGKNAR
jgi:apolipoprotein N-acyltransferase